MRQQCAAGSRACLGVDARRGELDHSIAAVSRSISSQACGRPRKPSSIHWSSSAPQAFGDAKHLIRRFDGSRSKHDRPRADSLDHRRQRQQRLRSAPIADFSAMITALAPSPCRAQRVAGVLCHRSATSQSRRLPSILSSALDGMSANACRSAAPLCSLDARTRPRPACSVPSAGDDCARGTALSADRLDVGDEAGATRRIHAGIVSTGNRLV